MKGEKGKTPTVQWYYKDWLSDKQLQRSRASTRGIWMNLLMFMIDCPSDRSECRAGRLEWITIRELCSLGACTEDEAWLFLEDALQHRFCDLEMDKFKTFHIMSRRLSNDAEKRAKWRDTKQKQREKKSKKTDVHQDVQGKSSQSPPLSPIPSPTYKVSKGPATPQKRGPGYNQPAYNFPTCPFCHWQGTDVHRGQECPNPDCREVVP